MRRRRKGLPVRHKLTGVFKLSAQNAGQVLIGDDFSQAKTCAGETEIRAVADSYAALEKRAELPGTSCQNCRCRTFICGSRRLRAGRKQAGGQNKKRGNEFFQHRVIFDFLIADETEWAQFLLFERMAAISAALCFACRPLTLRLLPTASHPYRNSNRRSACRRGLQALQVDGSSALRRNLRAWYR